MNTSTSYSTVLLSLIVNSRLQEREFYYWAIFGRKGDLVTLNFLLLVDQWSVVILSGSCGLPLH